MLAEHEIERTNWLARAVLAGFCATILMIIIYFYGYAVAIPLSHMHLSDVTGAYGSALNVQFAFYNLVHNPLVNFAQNTLYAAFALHFAIGIMWAVVYALFAEPRLSGPGWAKGMKFSLLPWILSLLVFLPLMGAGFFGWSLGAGVLPTIGNLFMHLAYGATLGAVYAPSSETLLERQQSAESMALELRQMQRSEGGAVLGLCIGFVVGLLAGLLMMVESHVTHAYFIMGIPDGWYVIATSLFGACLGALVGSLATLPTQTTLTTLPTQTAPPVSPPPLSTSATGA